MAMLNPKTLAWTVLPGTGKSDFNAEEGWTLLPDGSILTMDVKNAPNSERYVFSTKKWTTAGSTIVDLHSPSPFGCIHYGPEGIAVLLPAGRNRACNSASGRHGFRDRIEFSSSGSGAGHTAIYDTKTKTWTVGPDFPNGDNAGDSFAVLLPNGTCWWKASFVVISGMG